MKATRLLLAYCLYVAVMIKLGCMIVNALPGIIA